MHSHTGRTATTLAAVIVLAAQMHPASASWDHPHSDSVNTGFVKVVTERAVRPMQIVPVGELSSGAGPVIGSDGTVFVGNLFGQVLAFHPNGTPLWGRQLPAGQWVTASPVIGADGSVYVVSETRQLVPGTTTDFSYQSTLTRFSATGAMLFQVAFPEHTGIFTTGRGDANAAPNIWKRNGTEAILTLALYDTEWHLIAFSIDGQVIGDTAIDKDEGGDITTLPFCEQRGWLRDLLCLGFRVPTKPFSCTDFSVCLPDDTGGPMPGIAVWRNEGGGTGVVVSDGQRDTVGYSFDPVKGFTETFRVHDTRRVGAPAPVILPDGHTAQATSDNVLTDAAGGGRITFTGPNLLVQLADVFPLFPVHAPLTRLADGRLVAIQRKGRMSVAVIAGNLSITSDNLDGESVAPAAASCTYFYVASAGAFATYDVRTLRVVATMPWFGGGRSPPAIGPAGHVYAVASNAMFIFPPGRAVTGVGTACAADGNATGVN
jgi:hypothetical protein